VSNESYARSVQFFHALRLYPQLTLILSALIPLGADDLSFSNWA
jgi:hypothetical protein